MKRLKMIIYIFLTSFLFIPAVHAIEATKTSYVACGDATGIPAPIPQLTSVAYTLLITATPILLIVFSIATLLKAITAGSQDDIMKARGKLIKKFIIAGFIFFISVIVRFVVTKAADATEKNSISNCLNCFLYHKDCVDSVGPYEAGKLVSSSNSNTGSLPKPSNSNTNSNSTISNSNSNVSNSNSNVSNSNSNVSNSNSNSNSSSSTGTSGSSNTTTKTWCEYLSERKDESEFSKEIYSDNCEGNENIGSTFLPTMPVDESIFESRYNWCEDLYNKKEEDPYDEIFSYNETLYIAQCKSSSQLLLWNQSHPVLGRIPTPSLQN